MGQNGFPSSPLSGNSKMKVLTTFCVLVANFREDRFKGLHTLKGQTVALLYDHEVVEICFEK